MQTGCITGGVKRTSGVEVHEEVARGLWKINRVFDNYVRIRV